jgi:hypothetical protein
LTTLASAPAPATIRQRARRGLALYLAVLLPPSVLFEGYLFLHPEYDGLTALLAVLPAVASITARLMLREGFGNVSFRLRSPWCWLDAGRRSPSRLSSRWRPSPPAG